MMIRVLLVVVAMATCVNAGERYKLYVSILNPSTEDAMDKYRCCWGDYHLKVVLQKGMLDWYKIETQPPSNYTYQEWYITKYQIPMSREDKTMGPLTGYLLRYDRLQGEKYVDDQQKFGFFGIIETVMSPKNNLSYIYDESPYCFYGTGTGYWLPGTRNQTIPDNQHTVACMYNRPYRPYRKTDEETNNMVKKAFPSATYFSSLMRYSNGQIRLPNSSVEEGGMGGGMGGAHMSAGAASGIWGIIHDTIVGVAKDAAGVGGRGSGGGGAGGVAANCWRC